MDKSKLETTECDSTSDKTIYVSPTVTQTHVLKGMFWSFIDRGFDQFLRFGISIIMARIIAPESFGLVAMINIVFEIAGTIINGGFAIALINKKDHYRTDECTVFYFNLFMSLACALAVYISAPAVASFYRQPTLISIIRVLSCTLIASSFCTIQNVLLMKSLNFKRLTIVSVSTTLVSGTIAVIMAILGFGVWALVTQMVLRSVVYSLLLWLIFSWRPSLLFSIASLRRLFSYGSKMFASSAISIVFDNLHNLVIGRNFSAVDLAYFSRGKQLQQVPIDSLSTAIGRVFFPAMSIIKNDRSKSAKSFFKSFRILGLVEIGIMSICSASSRNIILLLYGEKWAHSEPYFHAFCLLGAFSLLDMLIFNSIAGYGKSNIYLLLNLIQKFFIIASLLVSIQHGILYMTRFYIGSMFLCFILNFFVCCRLFNISFLKEFLRFLPLVFSGAITYIGCFFIGTIGIQPIFTLSLQVFGGLIVIAGLNFAMQTPALFEIKETILLVKAQAAATKIRAE